METKIIAAGGLVENEKGELLMIYRRGKWDLPKGKLDEGESIEACAIREVEEETGLRNTDLGTLITITHHDYFDRHLQKEVKKETYWYSMKVSGDQRLVPQEEEDITDIRWVKENELAELLDNSYPNIVEVIAKRRK